MNKKAFSCFLIFMLCLVSISAIAGDSEGSGGSGSGFKPIFTLPQYLESPLNRYNIKYGTVELIYSQGPVITYKLVEKDYNLEYENILGYVHAKGYLHLKDAVDLYSKAGGYTFIWSYKDIQSGGKRDKWKW